MKHKLWWKDMGYETYDEYLRSDKWKKISTFIRNLHNHQCRICGSKNNLNVHHLEYTKATIRGGSKYKLNRWMTLLCCDCHNGVHDLQREKRISILKATRRFARKYGVTKLTLSKGQVKRMTTI